MFRKQLRIIKYIHSTKPIYIFIYRFHCCPVNIDEKKKKG